MRVHVTRNAKRQVDEIWLYLAELSQNLESADSVTCELDERIQGLARNPLIGRSREDLGEGFRSLQVGLHVVVYKVGRKTVSIIGVFRHTQNLPTLFQ
ncbi:MAG: type II toxin-antitoxin system RelE/ParE family toxin [Acidobacteria bacterium]|nr:type II toxin-antitoxin system RelE/ParE family toxin [Acidobacteriota bacterium]